MARRALCQASLAVMRRGRLAIGDERRGGQRAAVVRVALAQPVAPHFLGQARRRGRALAQVTDQQGVAAHLAVVVHAVLGVFGREGRPSRAAGPAAAASRCAGGPPGRCRGSGRRNPGLPAAWPSRAGLSAPSTRPRAPARGPGPAGSSCASFWPVALALNAWCISRIRSSSLGRGLAALAGQRSGEISARIRSQLHRGLWTSQRKKGPCASSLSNNA